MPGDVGTMRAMAAHKLGRATEQLLGIATGLLADGELQDQEIQFLRVWLSEHREVAESWPGSALAGALNQVLADGVITAEERAYLVEVLQRLGAGDFNETGSAEAAPTALPIDDAVTIVIANAGIVHTGDFLFGTRAAVERATLRAGGMPLDRVTRSTDILVIGSRVSPHWKHASFGTKILRAQELQGGGHPIEIISERRWLTAIGA